VFFDAYPNYEVIRESNRAFSSVAVLSRGVASWDDGGETRPVQFARVSATFFATMGGFPVVGATFTDRDEGRAPSPVVLVSHALWQSALASAPDVVGSAMTINGAPHTIIGVMPQWFAHPAPTDICMPFSITPTARVTVSGARSLMILGRLAKGTGPEAGAADAERFTALTHEARPVDNRDYRYRTMPYRSMLLGTAESAVVFIQAAAIALLVLAISNLAPLAGGVGIRPAAGTCSAAGHRRGASPVGAHAVPPERARRRGRGRAGDSAGVQCAPLGALHRPRTPVVVLRLRISIDAGVLLVGAAVSVGASLLAGVLPVLFTRRMNLADSLRAGGRTVTLSPRFVLSALRGSSEARTLSVAGLSQRIMFHHQRLETLWCR